MENQGQHTNIPNTGNSPLQTLDGFSAPNPPAQPPPTVPTPHPPRHLWRYVIIAVGIVSLIALVLLFVLRGNQQNQVTSSTQNGSANQRFGTLDIPLSELVGAGAITLDSSKTLSINGQLKANNGLVIAPSTQPTSGVAGQLYYDQSSNLLNYYNGKQFVPLNGEQAVQSIGGQSGTITLGGGLTQNGNQISNSGVLSLQGQSGAITLAAGPGVTIDGTTISSSGILSFGGQTGDITLGTGLSINNGQLKNSGVVSVSSSSVSLTVANDGNGNVTLGFTGGGTGTVQSPGGTSGRIAKFTGVQTIEDSLLSESGTTITVNGNMSVTGTLSLATQLSVANGGTGATSLTANGVLIGNGTGALTSVAAGGAGQCLLSTAGTPSWQACPGGGGVISLDGLTGALSLANSSGVGTTVTINDASTSAKGIAQFNSTNFAASGGTINTIQNINTSAAPTFGQLTLSSSQASAAMLTVNNTNVAATGNLIDLQLNGASQFAVSPAGALTLSSTINGQTISSSANFTGTLGISGLTSLNGGATVTGTLTANTITPSSSLTVGATGQSFTLQGNASSTITATNAGSTTSVAFQSPTASVTYRFLTTSAGTYDICTTAGNCAGVGGSVTTPGGTTNKLAKFTASQTIGDSIITDNGATVTIGGTLSVNTITPTVVLTIGATGQNLVLQGATTTLTATSGGITNSLVFATPSTSNKTITIPNATGTIAVSASGPLALDSSGSLTCASCVTSGGGGGGVGAVDSLDGLTGALTLANSSGSGATITIDNASTAQKGIAQFNSTNFSVSSGTVNTIQDINTTAAPTFGQLTLTSSQASAAMLTVNNTNGSATGNLIDLQLNGSSKFAVSPAGALTLSSTINGQTISSTANFTGTLGVGGLASLNAGATVTGTLTANTITPTSSLTVGSTSQNFTVQGAAGSTLTATNGANTTTLAFQSSTASVTYRFLTATAGTYDVCTTFGNCAGVGGGVTTAGGTTNKLAKFTGSQAIGDSIITDNGSTVTIAGTLSVNTLTPTAALTVGATSQNLTLQGATVNLTSTNSGITNSLAFATPSSSNKTITIPNITGTICLDSGNCLGGGGGGANTALSNLTGVAINTTLLPGAAGTINLGSGALPFGDLYLAGTSGTPSTNNFRLTGASTSGTRTITLPDASGTVCLQSSASCGFAASSGSTSYIQNTTTVQTNASIAIQSAADTDVTLLLKNGATQSADILRIVDNSSVLVFDIDTFGRLHQVNSAQFDNVIGVGVASSSGEQVKVKTTNASTVGLSIIGDQSAQTANLIQVDGTGTRALTYAGDGSFNLTAGSGQSASLLTLNNTSSETIASFSAAGALTLGRIAASGGTQSGSITFADGTNDNFGATLNTAGLSGSHTISLPDAGGTICLQSSASCGFAASSGSANYIQSQSASSQTADYRITGTGRADTSLQTPLLDTASAAALNIGTTNATSISLNQNTTIASGKTLSVNGTSVFKPSSNSTTAFEIQNAGSGDVFRVDTSTSNNVITNPSFEGSTTGWATKGTGTITRDTSQTWDNLASGRIDTTGSAAANDGTKYSFTLTASTQYTLSFYAKLASGSMTTLAAGRSDNGTNDIACTLNSNTLSTTSWGRYTCTFTTGGSIASSYFYIGQSDATTAHTFYIDGVQLDTGSTSKAFGYNGQINLAGTVNSPTVFQNTTNSATAFQIQNAAGTGNLLVADTVNNRIGIGTAAPSSTLEVNGTTTLTGAVTQGSGAVTLSANAASSFTTSSGALTITAGSSSTWSTSGGTLTLQSAVGITMNAASNQTVSIMDTVAGTISIGSQSNVAHTINIGKGSGGNQAQAITIGSNGSSSSVALLSGSGNISLTSNSSSASIIAKTATNSTTAFLVQDSSSNNILKVDTSAGTVSTTLGSTASTTAVCSSLASTTSPTAGTAYELRDCSGIPIADYAEDYPVANGIEVGDIVATGTQLVNSYDTTNGDIDWTKVKGQITQLVKTTQPQQHNVIGIVSDNNGDFSSTGHNIKAADNPMPVALSGRVPVKIAADSAPIEPGDYLTTSDTPGKATKAARAGIVIGKALEPWAPASGKATVMVYVEQGYSNPSQQLQGSSEFQNLTVQGKLETSSLNVSGAATIAGLTVTGTATIAELHATNVVVTADLTVNGHLITGGGTPTVSVGSCSDAAATIEGTDSAGTVTVTTNSTCAGKLASITFAKAFSKAPQVTITPADANAANLKTYVDSDTTSTTGFDIVTTTNSATTGQTIFKWYYHVLQ